MADEMLESAFEQTERRYFELASASNPDVPDEIRGIARTARHEWGAELDEHSRNGIYTIVLRGYIWRGAERGPTFWSDRLTWQRIEEAREASDAAAKLAELRSSDDPKERALGEATSRLMEAGRRAGVTISGREIIIAIAATNCLREFVPVWIGCPGGPDRGQDFYLAAQERVCSDLALHEYEVPENTERLAFRYGVCLSDVERLIHWGGPRYLFPRPSKV